MTAEAVSQESVALLRLRVVAEADPGALPRVLAHFQNLNVLPRRVNAEFATTGLLHVELDVTGISESRLSVITAKIGQVPCVLNAYWHRA